MNIRNQHIVWMKCYFKTEILLSIFMEELVCLLLSSPLGIFDRIHLKRLIISQRPKAVLLQTDGSFLAGFWKTICLWQMLYLKMDFFGMICIIYRLLIIAWLVSSHLGDF